jgi:phage terminase large subunit GpA
MAAVSYAQSSSGIYYARDLRPEPTLDDLDPEELEDFQTWMPEPEPFEDFLEVETRRKKLLDIPKITPSQFTEFAFRMPKMDGLGYEKFSFGERRHMRRPYDTPARRMLLFCGRQVEKSTLLGNIALCYSCLLPACKTLYVSPSSTQTKTFSADRIKEPIETSEVLRAFTTHMLSQNVFEKQFVNRSKITLRYAFLNADRCRGIPSWMLMLDELQDILADNIPVIEQSTSHAPPEFKRFVYAGTPKSLDNGIETYRQKSTQGEWVVPCDRCGTAKGPSASRFWNILGEKNIGKKGVVCERCKNPIDPMSKDSKWAFMVRWHETDAPYESYRIPQLMVPWRIHGKGWQDVVLDYERYPRDRFYNEVLGISYDSGTRPLTMNQLKDACNPAVSMNPDALKFYMAHARGNSVFCGIDWGCYSEDTRTLTEHGFRHHWEIKETDRIAQFDPKTGEISYVIPKKKIVFPHKGEMIHFKSRTQDLLVTPDHKMYYRLGRGPWCEGEAQDLVGKDNVVFPRPGTWHGQEKVSFTLPRVQYARTSQVVGGQVISMDLWLQFLGLLLSEGGLCRNKGKPAFITITQRDVRPDRVAFVKAVVEALPFNHGAYFNKKTGDHQWKVYGKELWSWVAEHLGETPSTKRLPREFLDLSIRQLQILYHAMMLGDGAWDKRYPGNGAYYSTSPGLCDDVLELVSKLGYRGLSGLHKPAKGNRKPRYRVSISLGKEPSLHSRTGGIKRVPYDGKAYCFSVPSGYFITERNGRIAQAGNTGEHAYTVLTLGTYVGSIFRVFYLHRFVGEDIDPVIQMEKIIAIIKQFNCHVVGTDYGGGFYPNDTLIRTFGVQRVQKYQYAPRPKRKVEWKGHIRRWMVHRTEVMSDVFNAIKRRQIEFPNWDEFKEPYGKDFLNIFSEYNETLRIIMYSHGPDKPDDSFHSSLYCFLASQLVHPRPDIIVPRKEDTNSGPIHGTPYHPTDQG